MEKLQLEEIRRNYYSSANAIHLREYKLEIWPGYITSIRQHEDKMLLCCELSSKVLRTDTVYEQVKDIMNRTSNHSAVEKALLGAIVITRYSVRGSVGYYSVILTKCIDNYPKLQS